MSKKYVNTNEFVAEHGHAPRGRGGWGFRRLGVAETPDNEFWFAGTYTEARKALPGGDWSVLP